MTDSLLASLEGDLRDQFAATALAGLLAAPPGEGVEPTPQYISNRSAPAWYAWNAYRLADAMIEARAQSRSTPEDGEG